MEETPFKRRLPAELEDDSWLISFADMCVLLMCFFVVMFAASKPDMDQFKKISESLKAKGFYADTVVEADPFEKLKKEIALALGASGYYKYATVSANRNDIEVELSSSSFFESGSAKFSSTAIPVLNAMAEKILPLAKEDIVIEVIGHTDDSPISSAQFPSNWELSGARAANVVRYLITKGFPGYKLKAVGLADTRPKAPNRDATGDGIPANQELNRRVVVKLIKGEDY